MVIQILPWKNLCALELDDEKLACVVLVFDPTFENKKH